MSTHEPQGIEMSCACSRSPLNRAIMIASVRPPSDMSLVGPRPPLQREVDNYGYDMHRRFLVKPGLTGLWQVSGRSDLSWDDSVRIDVRYVENWSFTFDLMILWKTVGAVLRGSGAY